jgi:hypothetical protein
MVLAFQSLARTHIGGAKAPDKSGKRSAIQTAAQPGGKKGPRKLPNRLQFYVKWANIRLVLLAIDRCDHRLQLGVVVSANRSGLLETTHFHSCG